MGLLGFVGDILNSKAEAKKGKADYNSAKMAWDQQEAERFRRCTQISNYMGRMFAQKGMGEDTYTKTDQNNCPPPKPYTGNSESGVSAWGGALKGFDAMATRAAAAAMTGGASEAARAAQGGGGDPYRGVIK